MSTHALIGRRARGSVVWEFVRAARALPKVEYGRRVLGPQGAVPLVRRMGEARPARRPEQLEVVRKAIGLLDRLLGPNCYRRVLLEVALDPTAAAAPVYFGLMSKGGARSGHAWLGHDPALEARYDAVFST